MCIDAIRNWFVLLRRRPQRHRRMSSLFHANRSLVETPEILVWDAHCLSLSLSGAGAGAGARIRGSMDYSSPWRIRVKMTD